MYLLRSPALTPLPEGGEGAWKVMESDGGSAAAARLELMKPGESGSESRVSSEDEGKASIVLESIVEVIGGNCATAAGASKAAANNRRRATLLQLERR